MHESSARRSVAAWSHISIAWTDENLTACLVHSCRCSQSLDSVHTFNTPRSLGCGLEGNDMQLWPPSRTANLSLVWSFCLDFDMIPCYCIPVGRARWEDHFLCRNKTALNCWLYWITHKCLDSVGVREQVRTSSFPYFCSRAILWVRHALSGDEMGDSGQYLGNLGNPGYLG